jgi:glycosyltransferase involved in cell wall biosynthesis
MNIWILNHYADTPDGQATRSYDLSKKLVERGHRMTIFAAGFSHYKFQEEHIRPGESWREEDCNGVRFIWLKTFPYRKNDWRRVSNMVGFAWRTFWLCAKLPEPPAAIIGVSVHPLAALAGWAASVVRRSRFFIELTDLWPEVLIDFRMLSRRNPMAWFLRALEKFLYRRAERIIMIWPRTEEYVRRLGVSPEKIVWIPHLADVSRYESLEPYDGRIRERFNVMYLGSFVSFMAMEVILKSAKILQDRGRSDIRFVLVGGGTDKEHLERLATQLHLGNVEFPGLVPKKDIVKMMSDADAYVVSLKDVPLLKYGISLNKACDYLASGRPTILAGSPGYDPIKEAKAGLSVPAENPEALADAIELLMTLPPEERVQMGVNGREYLGRVHGIGVLADRLEKVLLGVDFGDAASGALPIQRRGTKGHQIHETRA